MKFYFPLLLLLFVLISCKQEERKDNFSGTWLAISSNVNGDRHMPKDTFQGVLKMIEKNKGTYFFQIFDHRFLLDQINADSLVGPSESIKYIEKSNHIIFDMGNGSVGKGYLGATGESIFEFKKIK